MGLKMKLKNFLLFSAVIFTVSVLLSSCEDSTDIYHYRVEYDANNNDQGNAIVINYLADKGVFTGDRGFTGKRSSDNDNQALDLFDANTAKINRSELKELLDRRDFLHRTRVVFTYIVETGNASTGYVLIDAKDYVIEAKL
jgi:hypothetical protein